MTQTTGEPTRGKNILDIVLITNENKITSCEVVPGISDHAAVVTTVEMKPKHIRQNKRSVYLYNKGNMNNIRSDSKKLSNDKAADYQCKSVNELWNTFKTGSKDSLDKHIPQKKIGSRRNIPWITREIKRKINRKRRMYRRYKRNNSLKDKKRFEETRREIKNDLKAELNTYIGSLFE